jgi:hypothetical protein
MSTTAQKPRTTVAIAQASQAGTSARPKNGCKDCVKTGLAILPIVPTVAPKSLRGTSPELKLLDERYVPEGLQEHWYVLRTLPAGYLYVFKPADGSWDAYVVDAQGMLRWTAPAKLPSSPQAVQPMSEACARAGDNIPAQVIAVDPDKHPKIWMAFSRYRWSEQVLNDYAADKDGRRSQRMTQVDVKAAANNELGVSGDRKSKVPNGARMSMSLGTYVADYAPAAAVNALNRVLVEKLQARAAQTQSLVNAMAKISSDTPGKTGCLIVMDDPVGNAIELGASRDDIALEIAKASGLFDPDGKRARERIVAEAIEAIRKSAKENPGPWYDRNYGPERFMKHVNAGRVQAALQDSKTFTANLKLVDARSADYVAKKESKAWKDLQRWDFDASDDQSAQDHGRMVADSTRGSGVTKLEKERVWYPVLVDMQAADPDNWFYRALAALHPDLQAYFDTAKQWDKEYEDVPKAMATLARDIAFESAQEITKIHATIRLKRAANESTAALIDGVTGVLLHLKEKDPKAFRKLVRRMTVALITRADVAAQPVVIKGRYNQIVQMIQSVAAGDARLVGDAPVVVRPGAVDRSYMAAKGNLGGKGLALSEGVQGAVLLDLPSEKNEVKNVGAWVIAKLQGGGQLSADDLRKLGLRNVDLTLPSTVPAENVFLKNLLEKRANQSNVVLSSFAVFLQVVAVGNAANDLVTKPGRMDKAEATVGLTTAVMSAIAASLEVYTAVVALKGGELAAKTAMRTRWIARLAGGASLIEGAWLFGKGLGKFESDRDSSYWTMSAGVFLFAGGVTTIVGGGLVASAIGAGASALTVPVVGWAVATIVFLGVSIYCLVNAFSTDDDNLLPLEYWLDNGNFGTGARRGKEASPYYDKAAKTAAKPFASLAEEMIEFQRIVFAAAGKVSGTTDRNNNGMISFYEVQLPRWVSSSKLEMLFEGTGDGTTMKRIAFFRYRAGSDKAQTMSYENRVFGMSEDPKAEIDKTLGTMRVKGNFSTLQPGGIAEGVENFFEWVGLSEEKDGRVYIKDVRMTVTYWPDQEGMPGIVQRFSDWSLRSAG